MKLRQYYVYILASGKNGTLYIGVTNDLTKRIEQHKTKTVQGFTQRYRVDKLVYYEAHDDAESAISREKNMKAWRREWKIRIIEEMNSTWRDLTNDII